MHQRQPPRGDCHYARPRRHAHGAMDTKATTEKKKEKS